MTIFDERYADVRHRAGNGAREFTSKVCTSQSMFSNHRRLEFLALAASPKLSVTALAGQFLAQHRPSQAHVRRG
jgi:hypothetical protein